MTAPKWQSTRGTALGLPRVHYRGVDSTNERAKRLGALGAPHGTTVTAGEQTAGRGRQGRSWTAPAGSALLTSIVVRHLDTRDALLPLAAAVAVCEACEAMVPVECTIKWPNDVWIERRKVAGILVEGRPQEGWAAVGVGVNVAMTKDDLPADLRDTATSLRMAVERGVGDRRRPPLGIEDVLAMLTQSLGARVREPPERTIASWRERDALAGERVAWGAGEGTAAGVDENGALLVDTASGRVALDAGEVHLERPVR